MSNDSNPQPRDDDKIDSRLASFMRKAAPIITAERGLNPVSRLKLESLAKDMKLPEDLFEDGLAKLQGASPKITSSLNRWERAFKKRVKSQLKNLKGGILTARMERRAVRVAKEKYQLEEVQAREIIQQVAKEAGIGRISVSEAERHIDEMIRTKVGNSSWLDTKNRDLIHQAGKKWGLKSERVETLISHYIDDNRARLRSQKRWSRAISIVISVVLFLALGGVLAFFLSQNGIDSSGFDENDNNQANNLESNSSESDFDYPTWWTEEQQLNAVKARLAVTSLDPTLKAMTSNDATARGSGYRQLTDLYVAEFSNRESQQRLKGLMSGVFEIEPEDSAVNALLDSMIAYATPPTDELPSDPLTYEVGFALVEILARTSQDGQVSDERKKRVAEELTRTTGATPINAYSIEAVTERYLRGLSETAYRALISTAATNPIEGQTCQQWLRPMAEEYIAAPRLIELDSQFLLSVIPFDPDQWEEFRDTIDACITESNPVLYRFVTLAETTPNDDLQKYILRKSANVLEVDYESTDPEGTANRLRRKLGFVPGLEEDAIAIRWAKLRRRVDSLTPLERILGSRNPPAADEIVLVSHYASMACALAQFPPRTTPFDRLVDEGQPILSDETGEGSGFPESRVSRSASRTDRERLSRFVGRIVSWDRQSTLSRIQALRGLQSIADRFDDISRSDAEAIADYVVAEKPDEEHLDVLTTVRSMAHWDALLLAMADQVEQAGLDDIRLEQVVTQVAGSSLILRNSIEPRRSLRQHLLQTVLTRMTEDSEIAAREDVNYDRLQRAYLGQVLMRAALLSTNNAIPPVDSPSDAMRYVIDLMLGALGERDTTRSRTIESEQIAIQYLTPHDLGRTVLMQRLALELLKDLVVKSKPALRAEIEQTWVEFQRRDSEVTHLATQLYLGEWYQLQLWMMLEP